MDATSEPRPLDSNPWSSSMMLCYLGLKGTNSSAEAMNKADVWASEASPEDSKGPVGR